MKIQKSQFLSFAKCSKSLELGAWDKKFRRFPDISVNLEWDQFLNHCRTRILADPICQSAPPEWKQTLESESIQCKVEAISKTNSGEVHLWDFRPIIHIKKDWLRGLFFQYKAVEACSFQVKSFQVFTINHDFTLEGDTELLVCHDALDLLKKNEPWLESEWKKFNLFLNDPNAILKDDLPSCNSPKTCYFPNVCFGEGENLNIFLLRDGAHVAKKYWSEGKGDWGQIPETELSKIQKIQRDCHLGNKPYFDLPVLKRFLPEESEHLVFLDFETINPVIPVFQNTKPFQHIPFLFSIHTWNQRDSEPGHFSFLAEPNREDPRPKILKALANNIPPNSKILSYNAFFEKKVISESVLAFPEFTEFFETIQDQFVDLAYPFRSLWVYHPKQMGSASLKEILPAFTDQSYENLEVQGGQEANYLLLKCLLTEMELPERKSILQNLVHYCSMDTFAIYLLFKILREKIKELE